MSPAELPGIPNTLRICAGCSDELCVGSEFCEACQRIHVELVVRERQEALEHARRASEVFDRQPRETGRMPEDGSGFVARCLNAGFDWMDTLSPRQGLSLLLFGLAMSWLLIGWIAGRIAR